jgi:predicted transcriptional regulator
MSVEELKAEMAKLPAADRFELSDWIARNEDIRELKRAALIRDIQHGLEQSDRGEVIDGEEVFRRMRERWPDTEN